MKNSASLKLQCTQYYTSLQIKVKCSLFCRGVWWLVWLHKCQGVCLYCCKSSILHYKLQCSKIYIIQCYKKCVPYCGCINFVSISVAVLLQQAHHISVTFSFCIAQGCSKLQQEMNNEEQ